MKIFTMFTMMLISAGAGSFLYNAFILAVAFGDRKLDRLSWWRSVGAGSLLLSTSATLAVNVFFTEISMILILILLPIFMLAMQPGYSVAKQVQERRNLDLIGNAAESNDPMGET